MKNKAGNSLQQAAYREMEKYKPREAAVAAFKHKPYEIGDINNGEQIKKENKIKP